jgi:hypothetical protein
LWHQMLNFSLSSTVSKRYGNAARCRLNGRDDQFPLE